MKKLIKISVTVLVFFAAAVTGVQAADAQDPRFLDGIYYHQLDYPGEFSGAAIYKSLEDGRDLVASSAPANLRQVRCGDAASALRLHGHWVGRLDSRGKCLTGDPIEWIMGNYLNFISYQDAAE